MRISKTLFLISIILFFACLTQDGYSTVNSPSGAGVWLLLLGWITISDGIIAWVSNPFLILSWIAFFARSYIFSIIVAAIAFFLAASLLLYEQLSLPGGNAGMPGGMQVVVKFELGYWLWVASSILAVLASSIAALKVNNATPGSR